MDANEGVVIKGKDLATALFRIVQESLTNVARHAAASKVDIQLVIEGWQLKLAITDNGRGIPKEQAREGFGLISMRERAYAIGAEFTIGRAEGQGTVVTVLIPLSSIEGELQT